MIFAVKHPESFVVCLEVFWIGFRLGLGKNTWVVDLGRGVRCGVEFNLFKKKTMLEFGITNTFRLGTVVDLCGCSHIYLGPVTLGYSTDHPTVSSTMGEIVTSMDKILHDSNDSSDAAAKARMDKMLKDHEDRIAALVAEESKKSYKDAAKEEQQRSQEH